MNNHLKNMQFINNQSTFVNNFINRQKLRYIILIQQLTMLSTLLTKYNNTTNLSLL